MVGFFLSHAQVNDVRYMNDFDFAAQHELNYPAVNINYQGSSVQERLHSYSFKVHIGDLFDPNVPGIEDQIISDSLLIADDFLSWMQEQMEFEFVQSLSILPFYRAGGDVVSGVWFNVTISTTRRMNTCATPTRN